MDYKGFPRILLVDMNSFFASVEQQANPYLRGKPLGVSNSRQEGACLIGTSREAKALGIKNGMPLYKARKICPQILTVPTEPEKYREVNRRIVKILRDYTDSMEVYSIDEAFLDLNGSKSNPLAVGAQIKKRIRQEVGDWLTCSVGVAPNKFMAKLAADMQKPDGLSVVWRSNLAEIYKHKKLTDLWGVARGWEKRLGQLGITSPLQLLDFPVQRLISMFGKPGFFIWQRINGLEEDLIRSMDEIDAGPTVEGYSGNVPQRLNLTSSSDQPKSFGHSWVLNFRTTNKDRLKIAVLRLAEKAARRMRAAGFVASGMYLSLALSDGSGFHQSKKLKFIIETGFDLYNQALRLWLPWEFHSEVMQIAVGFNYLSPKLRQLSLFGDDKFSTLIPVLDRINDKYGEFFIRPGLLMRTKDFAPDAIAFGK